MLQKHNKRCLKPQNSDTTTLARRLIVQPLGRVHRATTWTRA